jgi:hypothetical protein
MEKVREYHLCHICGSQRPTLVYNMEEEYIGFECQEVRILGDHLRG